MQDTPKCYDLDPCVFLARTIIDKAIVEKHEWHFQAMINCENANERACIIDAIVAEYSKFPAWFGGLMMWGDKQIVTDYFEVRLSTPDDLADDYDNDAVHHFSLIEYENYDVFPW